MGNRPGRVRPDRGSPDPGSEQGVKEKNLVLRRPVTHLRPGRRKNPVNASRPDLRRQAGNNCFKYLSGERESVLSFAARRLIWLSGISELPGVLRQDPGTVDKALQGWFAGGHLSADLLEIVRFPEWLVMPGQ